MIVECSRRPDGWIPVKGNEKEICEFLLEHDFYKNFLIEKANDNFKFFHKNIPLGGYYYNYGEDYFDNEDDFFVKLNGEGSITVSEGQPFFKDYVAMEFNLTDDFDWVKWLFKAPNIHSLHQNQLTNTIKDWYMKPTPFRVQEGSILVFNKNSKHLHDVLDRTSVTIYDVLLENGYVVHGNSIDREIWDLEKRLQKSRNLEEKRCIIKRILSLKNSKNEEG